MSRHENVPTEVLKGFLAHSQQDLGYWLRTRDDLEERMRGADRMIKTRLDEVGEYTKELERRGEL